jgi:hypothetical protein
MAVDDSPAIRTSVSSLCPAKCSPTVAGD